MATLAITPISAATTENRGLNKLVVAHDFSSAANHALADAMAISRRFSSEVVIARVRSSEASTYEFQGSGKDGRYATSSFSVDIPGRPCREIVRSGSVAQTLFDIGREENPDLLLLGAYGHGSKDRPTLGSTAELLLRSISCPVVTYGPKVTSPLFDDKRPMSILVPIELPCAFRYLAFAVSMAKLFQAKLVVLHVVDMDRAPSMPHAFQDMQYACEEIALHLRESGVKVSGSLLFGKPDSAIISRCLELHSSFIMMPLETRGRLSSADSDNVAAGVIRNAEVPVMTYRLV
jgi:nucleotide-binding universal stress UspA family protein